MVPQRFRVLVVTALCILFASSLQAQLAPPFALPRPVNPLERVIEPSPRLSGLTTGKIPGAAIQKDLDTGQIRRVRGRVAVPGATTPRDAAQRFLTTNHAALGLSANLGELQQIRDFGSLTAFHVIYQQVYSGLPVFGGQTGVHLNRDLAVTLLNHDLIPITKPAAIETPKNPDLAVRAAVEAVNAGEVRDAPKAEPGVLVEKGVPLPVWKVTFGTRSPGAAWMVMVDAKTNRVLWLRNVAQYHRAQGDAK
jgi:Zn-dependent metalloprotease